jgi:hypothetical protein
MINFKSLLKYVILVLFIILLLPSLSQSQNLFFNLNDNFTPLFGINFSEYTDSERITLITTSIIGAGAGIFTASTYVFETGIGWGILLTLIHGGVGGATNFLFSKILIDTEMKWYWSIPYGLFGGALAGALAGIAIMVPYFTIGYFTETIDVGQLETYGEVLLYTLLAGSVWGGFTGALVGLAEGPAISLILRF